MTNEPLTDEEFRIEFTKCATECFHSLKPMWIGYGNIGIVPDTGEIVLRPLSAVAQKISENLKSRSDKGPGQNILKYREAIAASIVVFLSLYESQLFTIATQDTRNTCYRVIASVISRRIFTLESQKSKPITTPWSPYAFVEELLRERPLIVGNTSLPMDDGTEWNALHMFDSVGVVMPGDGFKVDLYELENASQAGKYGFRLPNEMDEYSLTHFIKTKRAHSYRYKLRSISVLENIARQIVETERPMISELSGMDVKLRLRRQRDLFKEQLRQLAEMDRKITEWSGLDDKLSRQGDYGEGLAGGKEENLLGKEFVEMEKKMAKELSGPVAEKAIEEKSAENVPNVELHRIEKLLLNRADAFTQLSWIKQFISEQQCFFSNPITDAESKFIAEFGLEAVESLEIDSAYSVPFSFSWLVQPIMLPLPLISDFKTVDDTHNVPTMGRKLALQHLKETLFNTCGAVMTICGEEGVGKTTLCYEFIFCLRSSSFNNIVVTWLPSQTPRLLHTSMIQFCQWRGIQCKDRGGFPLPLNNLVTYAAQHVNRFKDQKWVVVMDNASKDCEMSASLFQDVGAFVLVTVDTVRPPDKSVMVLSSLSDEDALNLIRSSLLLARNSDEDLEERKILQKELLNDAITLRIACACIRAMQTTKLRPAEESTLRAYVEQLWRFNQAKVSQTKLTLYEIQKTVVQLSAAQLSMVDEPVRNAAIQKICRETETLQCPGVVDLLLRESLITVAFSSLELTNLISIWHHAVEQVDKSDPDLLVGCYAASALAIFNRLDELDLFFLEKEFAENAHLIFLQELGPHNLYTVKMEHNVARSLQRNGEYRAGLESAVQVLKQEVDLVGGEDELTYSTSSLIASIQWCMGDYQESLQLQEEILDSMFPVLGKDHGMTRGNFEEMQFLLENLKKDEKDKWWEPFMDKIEIWRREYYPMFSDNVASGGEFSGAETTPTKMLISPGPRFYEALAFRESRDDPRVVNSFGFMGLYQMGPAALTDVGYMRGDGGWTGKNGIHSQSDFLNNPAVQNVAIREYHVRLWNYIPEDVQASVGRRVGGVDVTQSGILAAAHLRGQGGVTRFIRSNGRDDDRDEVGTSCSEYMRQFGGY